MSFKEKFLDSKEVYHGRLFNVRRDELEISSNNRVVREIVEHPGAVAIVPLINNRTVIMVEQYRHPAGDILLEIPAGTLGHNEKPEDCARRELIEEIGYKAGELQALISCYLAPGYSTELIHIYLATKLSKVRRRPDDDEFIKVSKIDFDRIPNMIESGYIKDAKTILALLFITFKLNKY